MSATHLEAAAPVQSTSGNCKLSSDAVDAGLAGDLSHALESLHDPAPDAVTQFEAGPGNWRVEAYFSVVPALERLLAEIGTLMRHTPPPLRMEVVPDLNWVAISQAALPPVTAGRFTVHGTHDRARVPFGPNAILIDAGEAFGTAHHPTTRGCLLAIDGLTHRRAFANVLDLGCGSGILAIAAARALPRARVLATDNDPVAVAVATANAKANGAEARMALACADGFAHPWLRHAAPFDLVIANILAGPLRALAADMGKAMRKGGGIILSGLLESEAPAIIAAYGAHGLALREHRRIAGWSTMTLFRRG